MMVDNVDEKIALFVYPSQGACGSTLGWLTSRRSEFAEIATIGLLNRVRDCHQFIGV